MRSKPGDVGREIDERRVRGGVGGEVVAAEEVLDAVDPHADRVARVDAVAPAGVEVAGDGEAVAVAAADQRRERGGRDALRLEPADAVGGPVVDLGADRVGGHRGGQPAGARAAEIGAGVEDARPHAPSRVDLPAQPLHGVRVHLAGREGGGDAVGQVDDRVDPGLVGAGASEQLHPVVRVQVEETGQQVLVRVEGQDVERVGAGRATARGGGERVVVQRDDAAGHDEHAAVLDHPLAVEAVAAAHEQRLGGGGRGRQERTEGEEGEERPPHRPTSPRASRRATTVSSAMARATASWTSRRSALWRSLAAVGSTRLVRSTTKRSRSGSIQMLVPV